MSNQPKGADTLGPMLTAERARELLAYDPATGLLTWRVNRRGPVRIGGVAGNLGLKGYTKICVDCRRFLAHRLAWLIQTGEWPKQQIDHINGVKTDNRWANLRDVSSAVNNQNRRVVSGAVPFLGVHKQGQRFVAQLSIRNKVMRLGIYETAEEAHAVYLAHKRQLHEGCTL